MRQPVRISLPALAVLLASLVLAGCGASNDSRSAGTSGPGPASVVPAGAAAYGELLVRPGGAVGADAAVAARRVLGGRDPGPILRKAVDANLHHGETYARDVDPWVGERLAAFLLLPDGAKPDPQYAVLLAVRDRAAFERALPRLRRFGDVGSRGGGAGSYRGVRYYPDRGSGTWDGIVGRYLVGGTPAAFHAVVDTWKGGASLAANPRYRAALAPLDPRRLALGYADLALLRAGAGAIHDAMLRRALASPLLAKSKPLTATFSAHPGALTLELDADASTVRAAADTDTDAGGSIALGALPADAWLALATPPLGDAFKRGLANAPGRGAALSRELRKLTGLDLDRDLLSWLGGVGAFVRGTNPLTIGGAVILGSRDAAASQRALARVRAAIERIRPGAVHATRYDGADGFIVPLPGAPQPLFVLARGDRVVVAFGPASARAALDGGPRFDSSDSGRAAIATLGKGFTPAFALVVDPVLSLVQATGVGGDSDFAKALPYLKAYRSLALGYKRDGDRFTLRLVAGLRDPGSAPAPNGGTSDGGAHQTTVDYRP